MSIFDPAKIARNKAIVDAMPEWKRGGRMNEKKLTEVERLRAINAQLMEALEGWLAAWEDATLLTSSRKPAELYRAGLLHDTKAAIAAAKEQACTTKA